MKSKVIYIVANCGFEDKEEALKFQWYYGFPDEVCSPNLFEEDETY